jgi:hypothetical protein
MTTTESPARMSAGARLVNWIITAGLLVFLGMMIYLLWPFVMERFNAGPLALPLAQPTAYVVPARPAAERAPQAPSAPFSAPVGIPAAPIDGIAQNAATAQAMFDAAVQAGEQPQQNVDNTGDTAPVIHGQRTNDRPAAGENVPTAEPVQVVTDWFGNKQKPINIQESHTCLHGQVWTGKGCRNP